MTEEDFPEFTVVGRGYDPQQVDDYVKTLRDYLTEMVARVQSAEQTVSEQAQTLTSPLPLGSSPQPPDFDVLGRHVAGILTAAQAAAGAIIEDAKAEASELVADARRAAAQDTQIVHQASAGADHVLADSTAGLQAEAAEPKDEIAAWSAAEPRHRMR